MILKALSALQLIQSLLNITTKKEHKKYFKKNVKMLLTDICTAARMIMQGEHKKYFRIEEEIYLM